MRLKIVWIPLAIAVSVFVIWGDRFLPSPLNSYSWQARTGINQLIERSVPQLKRKNPYDRTDKAIKELEQGQP
jgi:hypothetical protein